MRRGRLVSVVNIVRSCKANDVLRMINNTHRAKNNTQRLRSTRFVRRHTRFDTFDDSSNDSGSESGDNHVIRCNMDFSSSIRTVVAIFRKFG